MQLTAPDGHGPGQDRLPGRLHDVIPVTRKPGKRNTRNQLGGERRHREDAWRITTRTPLHTVSADRKDLFITEAIMSGLPPHIAQVIVGHRDINVTISYKAVYPEEAIQAHLAFLARRRAQRPTDEYRVPTEEEWQEFLGHFERRKVATGICGRAFGTPCIHEHSCLTEMILKGSARPAGVILLTEGDRKYFVLRLIRACRVRQLGTWCCSARLCSRPRLSSRVTRLRSRT